MSYNFDPELAPMIDLLPNMDFGDPVTARAGLQEMVALMLAELDESGINIEDISIAGPTGAPEIPVRIYAPSAKASTTAALIYIHGGGFVVGDLDTEHAAAVSLCRDLGVVLISVDYRLAPETPFPGGLEDCYATLAWVHANAIELNVDSERIGVMGGSAGGGLAAGLALLAKQRNGPAICFQMLGIPELDDRLTTASMTEFVDTPVWNRPNAIRSWHYYLGDDYTSGADGVPITAAPARATVDELRGLPPACVTTMEFDPLRDEGLEYAQKLLQAGVSVEVHSYPGTFHGSALIATASVSQRENADTRAVLKRGLGLE